MPRAKRETTPNIAGYVKGSLEGISKGTSLNMRNAYIFKKISVSVFDASLVGEILLYHDKIIRLLICTTISTAFGNRKLSNFIRIASEDIIIVVHYILLFFDTA